MKPTQQSRQRRPGRHADRRNARGSWQRLCGHLVHNRRFWHGSSLLRGHGVSVLRGTGVVEGRRAAPPQWSGSWWLSNSTVAGSLYRRHALSARPPREIPAVCDGRRYAPAVGKLDLHRPDAATGAARHVFDGFPLLARVKPSDRPASRPGPTRTRAPLGDCISTPVTCDEPGPMRQWASPAPLVSIISVYGLRVLVRIVRHAPPKPGGGWMDGWPARCSRRRISRKSITFSCHDLVPRSLQASSAASVWPARGSVGVGLRLCQMVSRV